MYDKTDLMFLYACAPVHMGAGVSLGPVDLPIQRERATKYPMMQGSGIKGALRHAFGAEVATEPSPGCITRDEVDVLFGPGDGGEGRPSDHAGALAFGDGRLILFPVRSLFGAFAYCTSRLALARLRRDLEWCGVTANWTVPAAAGDEASCMVPKGNSVTGTDGGTGRAVVLEDFRYAATENEELGKAAAQIADMVTGGAQELEYFRTKLARDIVLLSDEDFAHFLEFATEVEPHVAIDPKTGTAKGGAFFYEEHLPGDAVMYSIIGCSGGRSSRSAEIGGGLKTPEQVSKRFAALLGKRGRRVQFGGDGTTGRGIIYARLAQNGGM